MANAKTNDINEELRKLVASAKVILGTKRTLKELKAGKISKVYLAKNVKEETKNDFENYAKITQVELIELESRNDELGVICRKPFSIAVIGELKQ